MIATRLTILLLASAMMIGACASITVPEPVPTPAPPPAPVAQPPGPTAAPAPPPPLAAPTPVAEKVTLASHAFFDSDKAVLRPESKARLDDMASKLQNLKPDVALVIGHADSAERNPRKLAQMRAESVKSYLASKGISPNQIHAEGKGEMQPIADNRDRDGRAKNRRVEVEVIAIRRSDQLPMLVSEPQIDVVSILFATNRKKSGSNKAEDYFGDEEADGRPGEWLTLGRAQVRVPPTHRQGVVERPGWFRVTLEKLTPSQLIEATGREPFRALDPKKHFTFARPIEELTDEAFRSDLQKSLRASKSHAALLFVHGYANSFADAAYRTAQLTYDLGLEKYDVVPLMFSWPSDPNRVNYTAALRRAQAAGEQLAVFLNNLMETSGVGVVHIIAHSLGAEVLGVAFKQLGASNLMARGSDGRPAHRFNQVILAAPDIRARDFENRVLPAIASGHRVTNYASSNDTALRISRKANAGPMAGDSGKGLVPVKGVETIDASAVNSEVLGHSFFAESQCLIRDIKALLKDDAKPNDRGLIPVPRKTWTYWEFPRSRPNAACPS